MGTWWYSPHLAHSQCQERSIYLQNMMGLSRIRSVMFSLSPQVSRFPHCVCTQPRAGADESWGTKGMRLRPWLSESQGNIRIQCFLEQRGRGGCISHYRPTKESFKLRSKDNRHDYSSVCGSITQLASSRGRRTDDIRKEDAWSRTCPWADQVSTSLCWFHARPRVTWLVLIHPPPAFWLCNPARRKK